MTANAWFRPAGPLSRFAGTISPKPERVKVRTPPSRGEADSRRKLAEAEAYRVEVVGKAASEQLARDGALISQNPLLIQKTLADKLSDKISVIIAPPPESGGFIASGLLGMGTPAAGRPGPPTYSGARPISTSEESEQ